MKTLLHVFTVFIMLVTAQASLSSEQHPLPDAIVKDQVGGLLDLVAENKQKIGQDKAILFGIVEDKLLPHVDIVTMARKTMGKYWRRATKEQKIAFAKAYRNTLLRYTSEAFDKYDNQEVKFIPVDDAEYKLANVLVRTEITEAATGRPPIEVSFKFEQNKKEEWRVVDIYIEGVSMVLSKQREYGQMISRLGIDALIADLEEKNEQALAPLRTEATSENEKNGADKNAA
jgi:phospholipid transport system substrate-binding protein